MNLTENPIFITQKRIVHRGGVLAAILIAALVGFCLLLGLWGSLQNEIGHNVTPREAGKTFYGWTVGIEMLVLVVGGASRISRALADDRKAGLWDSNRLTPLKPSAIVMGYWFAPALREFYMALVLAGFGLLITLLSGLSITVWLGTQVLIAGTALFFGLLAVLAGMAFQRAQGVMIFLVVLIAYPFSFIAPGRMVTNFLLPIYGIGHFFTDPSEIYHQDSAGEWVDWPKLFNLPIHPLLMGLGLQFVTGVFVWRALCRKTANPFQPLMLRWEAVGLFGILSLVQQALIWDVWSGAFPGPQNSQHYYGDRAMLLPVVLAGTMFTGLLLLTSASPQPEQVRVLCLRTGFKNLGVVFSRSAISLALALAGISAVTLFTQFIAGIRDAWQIFAVTSINLTEIFLIFALLVEFCRLRHRRRSLGFMILWLFLLCAVPFILAAVFSNEAFAKISLLAPGFFAIGSDQNTEWSFLWYVVAAHAGVVVFLFLGWQREWRRLLQKAA